MTAAAVAFVKSRPPWQYRLLAIVVCGVVALGWVSHWKTELRDDGAQTVRDSLSAATSLRLHRQKDSVGERIDRQTITLTKTLHRTDTLWKQLPETLATRADTVKALDALPVLHRMTDSAIKACSEFQVSCAEYRRVSDSLEYALTADRDGWKRRFEGSQRAGKYQTVLKWAEIIGAGYLGYKAGRR